MGFFEHEIIFQKLERKGSVWTGTHFQFSGGPVNVIILSALLYLSTSCPNCNSNCFECRERFATTSTKKILT